MKERRVSFFLTFGLIVILCGLVFETARKALTVGLLNGSSDLNRLYNLLSEYNK